MPEFSSPFSGNKYDRKLTHEELVRAIRFMVAAEYEAHNFTCSSQKALTTRLPKTFWWT